MKDQGSTIKNTESRIWNHEKYTLHSIIFSNQPLGTLFYEFCIPFLWFCFIFQIPRVCYVDTESYLEGMKTVK